MSCPRPSGFDGPSTGPTACRSTIGTQSSQSRCRHHSATQRPKDPTARCLGNAVPQTCPHTADRPTNLPGKQPVSQPTNQQASKRVTLLPCWCAVKSSRPDKHDERRNMNMIGVCRVSTMACYALPVQKARHSGVVSCVCTRAYTCIQIQPNTYWCACVRACLRDDRVNYVHTCIHNYIH